jgi:hypothetical protein
MKKQNKLEEWTVHCLSKDSLPKSLEEWDKFLTAKKISIKLKKDTIEENKESE